jgi:hypothetical protein
MKALTILCGVAAVIALVALFASESRTRRELGELQTATRKAADRQSVASPSPLPSSVAADLHTFAAKMMSARPVAAETPRPAPEAASALHRQASRMTLAQEQEQVLVAYGRESVDPTWRRDAETRLDTAVRASLPDGSRLLSLECRTTMCMLEVSHKDEGAAHAVGRRSWLLAASRGWDGSFFVAGERRERGEIVQTVIPLKGDKLPIDTAP